MNKFNRLVKTLPSFYQAETSTYLRGLLLAWGIQDDEIEVQIREAKDQLFVEDASGRYLDRLASDFGVARTPELGIEDPDFRKLVPVLSTYPKQVRNTLIALFDVFWGPGFTRANINSGNSEPFNFGAPTNLTGTLAFLKNDKLVKGTGTSFLSEIQPGDYIRPSSANDTQFVKVSRILSNTELELSTEWTNSNIALISGKKTVVKTLSYTADGTISKTIRFDPSYFNDVTSIKASELATAINSSVEHNVVISADVFIDPISGSKLNIRTSTPGLQGSIQITGGTANSPAILNFNLDKKTTVKAAVYELNPNEIVVKIPSSVPVLRRSLKGAAHPKGQKTKIASLKGTFNFAVLGTNSTLTVEVDGTPYTVIFNHTTDFKDPSQVTPSEIVLVINKQLSFLKAFTGEEGMYNKVGLRTTEGSSEYKVTGGTSNSILQFPTTLQTDPDVIDPAYPSSYVFDPTGQLYTVTGRNALLSQSIGEGSIQPSISLVDSSNLPNKAGLILFNFGRSQQEGPISYSSRPNNSSLLIDPSHVFQKPHVVGRYVNLIDSSPTLPRVTGDDYPVYIVGTEEARAAAQTLIKRLTAAGVIIRFIIEFPEVLFECKISVSESPDYVGSRSGIMNPLFSCQ